MGDRIAAMDWEQKGVLCLYSSSGIHLPSLASTDLPKVGGHHLGGILVEVVMAVFRAVQK